jgi:hypothetical protein
MVLVVAHLFLPVQAHDPDRLMSLTSLPVTPQHLVEMQKLGVMEF